jgi:AAA domain
MSVTTDASESDLRSAIIQDLNDPRIGDIVDDAIWTATRQYPPLDDDSPLTRISLIDAAGAAIELGLRNGYNGTPWDHAHDGVTKILDRSFALASGGTNVVQLRPGEQPKRKRTRAEKQPPKPGFGAEQLDLNEPLTAREWLYANHYVRKYVTATIAPSKVGKTLAMIVECLAMAAGRTDIPFRSPFRLPRRERLRVWYVNGEDPIEEVKLRFRAAAQYFGVKQVDLEGWLFIGSGRKNNFVVARDAKGAFESIEPVVDGVIATIKGLEIDVLVIDPLVAFHNVPENDNSKMDAVIQLFKDIADETNIACDIVAHTRKTGGEPVTAQDFRGAGGQIGGVRAVRVVNLMTEAEGKSAGLDQGEYKWIIRLDNDSANMSKPGGGGTRWLRKVSVPVPVVDKDGNAAVEDVGTVETWAWPSKEEVAEAKEAAEPKLTPEQTEKIIAAIRDETCKMHDQMLRKDMQASKWAGYPAMQAIGLDIEDKAAKKRMDGWLKLLIASGVLGEETGEKSSRHPAQFITISEETRARLIASEN